MDDEAPAVTAQKHAPVDQAMRSVVMEDHNVIEEEHSQWKRASEILQLDPFLHHVNNYTNWYNNSHQIVRCLEDPNLHVRQKALLWAVELLATPEGRVQCMKAGMLEALVKQLDEKDMLVKKNIALAARHLAGMQETCAKMTNCGMVRWLLKMVSSNDELLRELSLNALFYASFNETARLELVHDDLTMPFIMKTSREIDCGNCATLCLKILQRCLAGGTDKLAISRLLAVDAISTLINLIHSPNDELKEASMRLLGLLCMHNDGKSQAEKSLGIDALLQILKEGDLPLQVAATSALMSLTINVDAKKDFIGGHGVDPLLHLLDKSSKVLSFNALQLATNIAEHPEGRSQLQIAIPKTQNLMNTSPSQIQKRFAKSALQQLKFKHRPFT